MSDQLSKVVAEIRKAAGSCYDITPAELDAWADAVESAAATLARQLAEAKAMLGQCYVIAGADTDGDAPERHAMDALRAVTDLRRDYDAAGEECYGRNGWQARAEQAESALSEANRRLGEVEEDAAMAEAVEIAKGLHVIDEAAVEWLDKEAQRIREMRATAEQAWTEVDDPAAWQREQRGTEQKARATGKGEGHD